MATAKITRARTRADALDEYLDEEVGELTREELAAAKKRAEEGASKRDVHAFIERMRTARSAS